MKGWIYLSGRDRRQRDREVPELRSFRAEARLGADGGRSGDKSSEGKEIEAHFE